MAPHLSFFKVCSMFCTFVQHAKHVDEVHGGQTDSIHMEFDHVLPLCGPGHVEKNIISATWIKKNAAICNFNFTEKRPSKIS